MDITNLEDVRRHIPDRFKPGSGNEKTFFSNEMEALYVFKNRIKYWEDIRAPHIASDFDLPISLDDFKTLTSKKIK